MALIVRRVTSTGRHPGEIIAQAFYVYIRLSRSKCEKVVDRPGYGPAQPSHLLTIAHAQRVRQEVIEPDPVQSRTKGCLEIRQTITDENVRVRSDIAHPYVWIELRRACEPLTTCGLLEPPRKLTDINDRFTRDEREQVVQGRSG